MKMMKMLKLSCAAVIAMAPGAERRKARRCAKRKLVSTFTVNASS